MNKLEWENKWESVVKYCDECKTLMSCGNLDKIMRRQAEEYGLCDTEEELQSVINVCRVSAEEMIFILKDKYNSGEYLSLNEDIINIDEAEHALKDLVDMLSE